jgi:two-component system, cell cycle sensor histidine kinase and response regulator CckA
MRDITARKQAEEEKNKLEAQLIQAQKLEALGTVAGGIAYDFNNILGAIIGYADLSRLSIPEPDELHAY